MLFVYDVCTNLEKTKGRPKLYAESCMNCYKCPQYEYSCNQYTNMSPIEGFFYVDFCIDKNLHVRIIVYIRTEMHHP